MIIDCEAQTPNYKNLIGEAFEKASQNIMQETIRNCDSSKLSTGDIKYMIGMIEICENHLELLLRSTQRAGGFCSIYSKRCLDELSVFKIILVMELDNAN